LCVFERERDSVSFKKKIIIENV